MNIRETFIELTQYTEVLGDEHLLKKYLPEGIQEDHVGNYYMKIGESDTMFTSHLDTAAHSRKKVTHVFDDITSKNGRKEYFIETDGTTLLGADDRAGVVIMLYMIKHKIPGLYYFFIGEERGTVGSSNILLESPEFFEPYNKCISFDRRGYGSVITVQMGGKCCSTAFANALSKDLKNATGYNWDPDPTGIYTDSAVFMDDIAECTNLSVGYFNEHSVGEFQNITYLEDLCEGVIKVNWEELPVERDPGPLDTPNPKRKKKKAGDLSDKELGYIFLTVEDIFEETQMKDCVNRDNFMPEKEMLFVSFYDEDNIVSVWIHDNGSITIGNNTYEDINELEDQVEAIYGYKSLDNEKDLKTYDDYDDDDDDYYDNDDDDPPFDYDDDDDEFFDADEIDLSKDTFENDININEFISDVAALNKKNIPAERINKILNKYNKTIESLIVWLYNRYNDASKTYGLTWDDVEDQFEYDSNFNKPKSTGIDTKGARTFD
jgi:hypothetical protein